jgi:preprotein translocase subunit SecA
MVFLQKLFGDPNERELKRLWPIVSRINALEEATRALSDEALRAKTAEFREAFAKGKTLDELLPEAFACVREAARRTLGQRHFDVQLLGGIILHEGKIAEMRTGEGKTLAATAPAYLNAIPQKGVHIVTVNDYLARRDTVWMGQIYDALGMTVGCVTQSGSFVYDPHHRHEEWAGGGDSEDRHDEERDTTGSFRVIEDYLRPATKKEAYACDITYGTNNEFGFDYLRDHLVLSKEEISQRGHAYAIVDEVDSILIDEARTPLIISSPDTDAPRYYETFARLAPRLKEGTDYNVDEKRRSVLVTEDGVRKVEQWLGIANLYEEGFRLVHFLEQALRAQVLYQRDRDYIVRDGEVIIVDEFTGRIMPGRRWSDGLHQAIEAKEGVKVQAESRTIATITFQNYFRMYEKLAGMTGTAATSAEEFAKVYRLEVIIVPTHKPMIRIDKPDLVFRTEEGKWRAIVRLIRECRERGQPVLVGTTSIAKNEHLSAMLAREGIPHEVLNAKHHEREGAIIAQAGRKGAVTVATNMAGRGVDIILGGNPPDPQEAEDVRRAGGLFVIGTERHEARRIDNQLRGRAGRQGDPGMTQFFLSLEDDLLRIFGGDRLRGLMERLNVPEDEPIESGMVAKAIESAQARIEGHNFDIRKHLLEYDDVMNKHREAIYRRRRAILYADDPHEEFRKVFEEEIGAIAAIHLAGDYPSEWNVEEFVENLKAMVPSPDDLHGRVLAIAERGESSAEGAADSGSSLSVDARRNAILALAMELFEQGCVSRREAFGEETFRDLERQVLLRAIDMLWMEHLETMEALRDAVSLRGYGQRDPLVEYKTEAQRVFRQLEAAIRSRAIQMLFRAQLHAHETQESAELPRFAREPNAERRGMVLGAPASPTPTQRASFREGAKGKRVGRNDPCPCGSGKKYKKCHGA